MLKAVRFDEEKHKDLLNYITGYEDHRGKSNESEAIRYLMKVGYETLHNLQPEIKPLKVTTEETPQTLDMEALKKELLQELSSTIQPTPQQVDMNGLKQQIIAELQINSTNQAMLEGLEMIADKLSNLNITTVQEEKQVDIPKPKKVQKKIDIPKDTNPLLANLLANSER